MAGVMRLSMSLGTNAASSTKEPSTATHKISTCEGRNISCGHREKSPLRLAGDMCRGKHVPVLYTLSPAKGANVGVHVHLPFTCLLGGESVCVYSKIKAVVDAANLWMVVRRVTGISHFLQQSCQRLWNTLPKKKLGRLRALAAQVVHLQG